MRKKIPLLITGIFLSSFFDLIGLAAILPLVASILQEGFITSNPYTSFINNALGFEDERWFILFLSGVILTFTILKNLFGLWISYLQTSFSWKVCERVSTEALASLYAKNFHYLKGENSNFLLNTVSAIPTRLANQLILPTFLFVSEIIVLTMIMITLVIYDAKIVVLLVFIILPFMFVFYKIIRKRIGFYNKEINQVSQNMNKTVFDIIFGFVDLKIGRVFGFFQSKFRKSLFESTNLRAKLSVIQQTPTRLNEFSLILAIIIILIYGIFYVQNIGEIVSLLSVLGLAAFRTLPSLNRLLNALISIRGQEFVLNRLETFSPIDQHAIESEELVFSENIIAENITFKFPDQSDYLFQEFNLEVKKGESIGIIGKSGSGKTTLMNILIGLVEPNSGMIKIDGTIINNKTQNSWYQKIGYVNQEVFIMDGTLKENIAFGIPNHAVNEKKVFECLKEARLTEVVKTWPLGILTKIGERGSKISGGQRQRIAIARALYHDAEVLFFDEATSALDYETEREITESIRQLKSSELTLFIIAHRKASLVYCDRIIDLSDNPN